MTTRVSSPDLEEALAQSAEPEVARANLERLLDSAALQGIALPSARELELVAPLLACPAPAGRLIASPRLATWLARTPWLEDEKPARVFERELMVRIDGISDAGDLDHVLRACRHREMARIALRDLTRRAPLRVVVRELSHLADALVEAALGAWDRMLGARFDGPLSGGFCVVAMGKHGAEELNYSSDIDVLFLLDQDDRTGRRRDQAVGLARAVIRALSATTEEGFCFRVDANLRPYGRDGPLVQTIGEMEAYYEHAGQTWERAALIKARPCAGALGLGQLLLDRLQPFVFRRTLDLAAVEALTAMKGRIDRDQARSPRDNVKLGSGGIREVEFFVQALQLLHGGRQPALRVRGTLAALEALQFAGFLPAQDQAALAEAYVFLRDTEHRLQLPEDRQTQVLPEAEELGARLALARRMGFRSTAPFEQALIRHRASVHRRFVALLDVATEGVPPRHESEQALDAAATEDKRKAALTTIGFVETDAALGEIRRLQRVPDSAFGARMRERHPGLGERLLEEIARSPDPDLAIAQFGRLFQLQSQPAAVAELFAANPATARLLLLLFGSSETLARDLQLHPELLDSLVRSDVAAEVPSRERLRANAIEAENRHPDIEARVAALRTMRREETLRIGLMDMAGRQGADKVGVQLSDLADVLLDRVLAMAREEIAGKFGEPTGARLAILGLGSFGGQELDYESDLDLVFVYEASGATSGGARSPIEANEWAARVVQRLLSHLSLPGADGVLYRVDARLRPSGTQGPLVTSLEAFARYHGAAGQAEARGAALWERQALLRARPVAGDESLGAQVVGEVLEPVAQLPVPADAFAQIAEMRYRLDETGPAGGLYPKKSAGGLLDIEFLTQAHELRLHLRVPSTRRALDAVQTAGGLDRERVVELKRHFEFLRRVESRLRLRYWRTDVFVPAAGPGLHRLARQLGDAGADAGPRLWRDLTRTMTRVREIFREQMQLRESA